MDFEKTKNKAKAVHRIQHYLMINPVHEYTVWQLSVALTIPETTVRQNLKSLERSGKVYSRKIKGKTKNRVVYGIFK